MKPTLHLPALPAGVRLSDYLGVWCVEPQRFLRAWHNVQALDLVAHFRASTPAPKADAPMQLSPIADGKSIAVIPIVGEMMKGQSSLGESASTILIRRQLRQAAADPNVVGILLAIDSPGGTVAGTADLAADVLAARKQKPVYAQIEDLGASAAYWVASQAEKVFANQATALVGSIGTYLVVDDTSAANDAQGVKTLVFRTGPLKGAGIEGSPVTDEQAAHFQQIVNDLQVHFDSAVQKARKLTDNQLAQVRSGGVFAAGEALRLKLIDGIQSLDRTREELAKAARTSGKAKATVQGPAPITARRPTMDFEAYVRSLGLDPAALSPEQETSLRQAWGVLHGPPSPNPGATLSAVAPIAGATPIQPAVQPSADSILRQERERVATIERECQGDWPAAARPRVEQYRRQALAGDLSVDGLRANLLTALREGRMSAPNIVTGRGSPAIDDKVVECALAQSINLPNREKHYTPEILEAAQQHFKGRLGLQQFLLRAAAANGYSCSPGEKIHRGNFRTVMQHLEPRAGFSTVSVPGILGNVANKSISEGFNHVDDGAWRAFSKTTSVSDFKTGTQYRLNDDMEYEEVAQDGEIAHGQMGEESYTHTAKLYAKMFALTMVMIINDDLGAFDDLRRRIGMGSARKLRKLIFSAMMDNSTFFTSTIGNYITGATTNLATDGVGLELGVKAFYLLQSTLNGTTKRIGGVPISLVVPPELMFTAERLFRNANLGVGTKVSDANINAGKYQPYVAPELSDANFTGNSSTAWYLFRDPQVLPAVLVSFLDGQEMPTVEESDAEFNVLGIQMRGYHGFGADKAEPLCGIKSKGAA
jgi:signal peptide peptidase SppA